MQQTTKPGILHSRNGAISYQVKVKPEQEVVRKVYPPSPAAKQLN